MLNSIEHEILNAHKDKNIQYSIEHEILNAHKDKNIHKFAFLGSDKPRMLILPGHKC